MEARQGQGLSWGNNRGCRLVSKKVAAYRRYRQSKSYKDYKSFAKVRNKVTTNLRKEHRILGRSISVGCERNPKVRNRCIHIFVARLK